MENKMELLQEAYSYCQQLVVGVNSIIDCINVKNFEGANKYIIDLTEGISWLLQVFDLTSDIQKEKLQVSSINVFLQEGIQALSNKDYNLLSELIQYEFIDTLKEWEETLAANFNKL